MPPKLTVDAGVSRFSPCADRGLAKPRRRLGLLSGKDLVARADGLRTAGAAGGRSPGEVVCARLGADALPRDSGKPRAEYLQETRKRKGEPEVQPADGAKAFPARERPRDSSGDCQQRYGVAGGGTD